MLEVTIYATDVDDLRAQLLKAANVYGTSPPVLTGVNVPPPAQQELPFSTANSAPHHIGGPAGAPDHVADAPVAAEAPAKRGRKPKNAQPASETPSTPAETTTQEDPSPAPTAAPASPAVADPAPAGSPSAPTEDAAREALGKVNTIHGMMGARAAVLKFGVQRFSDLDPAKYGEFIAYCEGRAKEAPTKDATATG